MSLSDFSPHPAAKSCGGGRVGAKGVSPNSVESPSWSTGGAPTSPSFGGGNIEMPALVLGSPMLTSPDYGQQTPPSSRRGGTSHIRSTYCDSTSNATPNTRPDNDDDNAPDRQWQHLYVLPVLLLEFLAIALTRAVLPTMLLQKYGSRVYIVLGCADCARGLLAFLACPVFGKLSDLYGRRICLLMTVIGSCAPVCSLALFSWKDTSEEQLFKNKLSSNEAFLNMSTSAAGREGDADVWPVMSSQEMETGTEFVDPLPPYAITVFVILLVLSGAFSSTFTLVFAYISDTVRHRDERVAAYGLALATFGLSFTIGPMAGGYLAESNKHDVFMCSFFLTCLAVLYIYFILPESTSTRGRTIASSAASIISLEHNISWSPRETMRIITMDPFLRRVGQVAFLYYTGLWALISTLSLYAVQRFHLTPQRLGELMSTLGLCTMLAEAVLLRILVPMLGEKSTARLGLLSFAMQCILLGFAYEGWHLFVCALFSMLGNLVYPSLSSLVSGSVEPDAVGEALGALNGVKALTEGIGPLVFGSLMTFSEKSALPGWPYLVASLLVFAAYQLADGLPDDHNDDYIHELEFKKTTLQRNNLFPSTSSFPATPTRVGYAEEEYQALLSEIDEEDDGEEDGVRVNFSIGATC